jgi:two-component system, cell cycle response regulator
MPRDPSDDDHDREEDRTAIGDLTAVKVANRRDRAHLIVLAGGSLGQMFRVEQRETVIGRAADAGIRLDDDGVSRRHARVVQLNNQVWIEDLESANGTFVNEGRVDRQMLRDGDKIQMGSTTILKFTYGDELEENFQQRMYDAALHDGLTGAFNKRHFLDRMPTEIAYARRHKTPLTLLMFDVDHFKQVNDRHGHVAGDYVLATIATLVTSTLRTEDLFARYGGEEFAVLCRGATLEKASVLAERLRAKVETHLFAHHGQRIAVTISVGVATFVDHPDAATQLIADADGALYRAKRAGRNRVLTA